MDVNAASSPNDSRLDMKNFLQPNRDGAKMSGETDLSKMLSSLDVEVRPGSFAVVSLELESELPPNRLGIDALITEAEGITVVAAIEVADENNWEYDFVAGWLTLRVHSALEAVGLTAAFSAALGDAQIPCNVLAGYYHDHILVPHDRVAEALGCLNRLSAKHQISTGHESSRYKSMTAAEVASDETLADWRFVLGRIESGFAAESFTEAARFVSQVAALCDAADHHPDLDIRYPGDVLIALVTHATAGITDRDIGLARQISSLAAELGLASQSEQLQRVEYAIDALDIEAVLPFWAAVMGYERTGSNCELTDPRRGGPAIWFQQMDEQRSQRNRVHLDVSVPHDIAELRVEAALAAGGVLVSDKRARSFWILADVEGNEVCVCTWQDRV